VFGSDAFFVALGEAEFSLERPGDAIGAAARYPETEPLERRQSLSRVV
jgi:hypothetical protein